MEQADQSLPGPDFCLGLQETHEAPGLGTSQATQILHPWTSGHSSLLELSCSELRTLLRAVTLPNNAPSPFPFPALRLPLPRPPVSWQDADRLSLSIWCPKRGLVYSAHLPRPDWSSSKKHVFRVRGPAEASGATEFSWGQGGCRLAQTSLAPLTLCPGMGFLLVEEGVLFPDMHTGQSLSSQDGRWASSIGVRRSMLEMQAPRPHPRPLESEPVLQKSPR